MSDMIGLLPCSECMVFPDFYNHMNDATIAGRTKLECPNCGKVIMGRNYGEAAIIWNNYNDNNSKKKKIMAIVEFKDHHYELVDWLYCGKTGKIQFTVNGEEYLYYSDYFEDEPTSKCCGVMKYMRHINNIFLKYDKSIGKFCITDDIIKLFTSETDEGIEELKDILQTTEEKQKEENEMKDILELVGKIEELLKKSKFEWFMAYDPKSKAWNFQLKEK